MLQFEQWERPRKGRLWSGLAPRQIPRYVRIIDFFLLLLGHKGFLLRPDLPESRSRMKSRGGLTYLSCHHRPCLYAQILDLRDASYLFFLPLLGALGGFTWLYGSAVTRATHDLSLRLVFYAQVELDRSLRDRFPESYELLTLFFHIRVHARGRD